MQNTKLHNTFQKIYYNHKVYNRYYLDKYYYLNGHAWKCVVNLTCLSNWIIFFLHNLSSNCSNIFICEQQFVLNVLKFAYNLHASWNNSMKVGLLSTTSAFCLVCFSLFLYRQYFTILINQPNWHVNKAKSFLNGIGFCFTLIILPAWFSSLASKPISFSKRSFHSDIVESTGDKSIKKDCTAETTGTKIIPSSL